MKKITTTLRSRSRVVTQVLQNSGWTEKAMQSEVKAFSRVRWNKVEQDGVKSRQSTGWKML